MIAIAADAAAPDLSASRRLDTVEQVKGLAILLVVAAHLVKYQTLPVAPWYEVFKFKVYLFHMPLFMFISGYVYFFTGAHARPLDKLGAYARRRADRLLVPFFALGLVTVLGKWLLQSVWYVDEAPASLWQGLLSLFMHTESSPVLTVWYLFVLFAFSVLTPFLYRLTGGSRWLLLALAAYLYFAPMPDALFANRIMEFYVFFIAGGAAQSFHTLERAPSPGVTALLGVLFAALLALPMGRPAGLLLCGLAAGLAVPALLRYANASLLAFLHFCGRNSMAIYLFNVMSIGLAKAVFMKLSGYDASLFYPLLFVTFLAGLLIPIFIRWASGLSTHTALFHKYIS